MNQAGAIPLVPIGLAVVSQAPIRAVWWVKSMGKGSTEDRAPRAQGTFLDLVWRDLQLEEGLQQLYDLEESLMG